MTEAQSNQIRLAQLLQLVQRQDAHLLAVRQRLLDDDCVVDASRLQALLAGTLGIDRLESFAAKFARMQDITVDKLIPVLLHTAGEPVLAAIDNLNRMERLGLIVSAGQWQQMRGLRNRLVHEYFDRPADLAPALQRACEFTSRMHADFQSMQHYAVTHLRISLNRDDRA